MCLSAGNHLTPWYRRQLEAVFAGPVRERYAVSEIQRTRGGAAREGVSKRLAALVGPETRVLVRDVARLEPGTSGKLPLVASV